MRNNEIVKGAFLQLAGPIPHCNAVGHSVMQYCEIHDFVSLQIHVQGPERRGRRRCQPPFPTATPARRAAAPPRLAPASPDSAAACTSACLCESASAGSVTARAGAAVLAPAALAAAGASITDCRPAGERFHRSSARRLVIVALVGDLASAAKKVGHHEIK
jgi:hypothetical protein